VVVGDTDASMAAAYMRGCDKGGKVGAGWLMGIRDQRSKYLKHNIPAIESLT
jgi:hypothetical protein